MALATQCPHCHTVFRVAHDQLKLRAGLVRCGACKQIFNGIENLLRADDAQASVANPTVGQPPPPGEVSSIETPSVSSRPALDEIATPPVAAEPQAAEAKPATAEESSSHEQFADNAHDEYVPVRSAATAASRIEESTAREETDPLLRMTLVDIASHRQAKDAENANAGSMDTGGASEDRDPLDRAMEDLQSKPLRNPESGNEDGDPLDHVDDAYYEEPSFVTRARRRQRFSSALQITLGFGSAVFLAALLAQGLYLFRDQVAVRFPQTRQALMNACSRIGCQVGLPAQIDAVSIESNELQALSSDGSRLSLNVLLRNHSTLPQAWPNIELTLNDTAEKPIARRVFVPAEYLPAADFRKGFAPNSEQPVKLVVELTRLKPSGYRVYLFYP